MVLSGGYSNMKINNKGFIYGLIFAIVCMGGIAAYKPFKEDVKTAFGELLVGELHPVFQGSFDYTVDNTLLNTNTVTNGGTVTQASAMAVLSTSTTTNSTAMFQTKQHAKYRPGLGGLLRFTALFTSPVADTQQLIGLSDQSGSSTFFKNGFMVGYNGNTFGFHRFQNDVLTTVTQANWDDPLDGTGASAMTLDQTKINVWQIRFQYLGGGAIQLWVEDDDTGNFVLVHTIDYANQNTSPSVHNPNFHYTMWVDNNGTTSDMILKGASYAYFIEGKTSLIELHQPQNSTDVQEKTSVTTEVAIFTIRNRAAYAGKTNYIDVVLESINASIEANSANNLGNVRVIRNATLGGSPSFSNIGTDTSVVEIDTAGTTVTGGTALEVYFLAGKNDKIHKDVLGLQIILNPNDTITLSGTSANSATIDGALLWKELFYSQDWWIKQQENSWLQ